MTLYGLFALYRARRKALRMTVKVVDDNWENGGQREGVGEASSDHHPIPSVGPTRVAEVHRAAPQTCKGFKYSIKDSGNVDWRSHECLYTGCDDCLRALEFLTSCHTKLNYGAIYDACLPRRPQKLHTDIAVILVGLLMFMMCASIGVFSALSKQKARNAATAEKRRAGKYGEAVLGIEEVPI
ncbi:hypothetical protein M408DRAFT_319337 [Serendipita vermifera MAFF 305830]|uniref:Uncharacterized protein n=1 Tax=Serendipita vermifera MAFF 305830 TaxID=933852 RepID=A0A0C3AX55_SERVB|nr:hypothetical protein M408DRAFT_319337 [Serendipita vermifera MAFF 305830]